MSDKTFEWSLTAVVAVAVLLIVAGIVLTLLGIAWPLGIGWAVIIGIVIVLAGGGVLTHYWGKNFMARR